MVDDFSSKLDLPDSMETVESIDANHRQMAKCRDRRDAQYRAILGILKQCQRSGALNGQLSIPQEVEVSTGPGYAERQAVTTQGKLRSPAAS